MDKESSIHRQNSPRLTSIQNNINSSSSMFPKGNELVDGEPNFHGGGDSAVWAAFTDNFSQVQSVLDRNRLLIQQVNENHRSKIHDNLVKNVALIQEINGNIAKVVSLYSNLSADFSSVFHQQNGAVDAKTKAED